MKELADKIRKVGLIAHSGKASCAGVVRQAARLLHRAGRRLYADAATAQVAGLRTVVCPEAAALAKAVDLLLVFGGDGTLLGVAREIAGCHTPLLGINIGSLGFLTAVPSDDLSHALKRVLRGEFTFESRVLLQAEGACESSRIRCAALNDIVIGRGISSRLIEVDVAVNGHALTRYRCDGLIVCSPTGSTAYSLAAGGAVVYPTAEVMELTPICPHTLSNRSLILPLSAVITMKVISPRPETILSADGLVISELAAGDVITVRRSHRSVRLMHLAGSSFGESLRRKLHWRGTPLASP